MRNVRIQIQWLLILVLAGGAASFGQTVPPTEKAEVDKRIALLQSDAPHKEKVDALRELAFIADKSTIAPLAALLGDEKLSHMARYALEPIADPAVDEAFREALGKLTGGPLVGVIGSCGARHDAKAVKPLRKMLGHSDAEVAQATAKALGSIGNLRAAKALSKALQSAPAGNRAALCEGLFRCAESLAKKEQRRAKAIEFYDLLRQAPGPRQIRAGALRGAILARPDEEALSLLREQLRSPDYALFSAAAQTALEMPGTEVTQAMAAELGKMPANNQILTLQTLAKRADAAALPGIFPLAASGPKPVRIAAIRVLPAFAHGSAAPVLARLLEDADPDVSKAALEALAALPGGEADQAVMAMLESGVTGKRLTAIDLVGRRRTAAGIPALLTAAGGEEAEHRLAALKRVGELGGAAEVPSLLGLLMRLKEQEDLNAADRAVIAICLRTDKPKAHNERVINLLAQAEPAQKSALLRILGAIGGADALKAIRTEVGNPNAEVHAAVVNAFVGWKTADATPDLLALAKSSPDSSQKIKALRGYISRVQDKDLSTDRKLEMAKAAAELVQRDEEKKLLIGVLAKVPASQALSMVTAHLGDPAVKEEACVAALAICEKIGKQKPDEVKDALRKAVQATENNDVANRAKKAIEDLSKPAEK